MEHAARPPALHPRAVASACLTAGAIVLLGWALYQSRLAIAAVLAAALVATALARLVDRLCARGLRRGLANALVVTGLVAGAGGLVYALAPVAIQQVGELVERAPSMWEEVRQTGFLRRFERRFHVQERIEKHLEEGDSSDLSTVAPPAVAAVGSALGLAVRIVTVLFLVVFMLLFGRDVVHAALVLAPPDDRARVARVLGAIYDSVGGYLSGLGAICTINAACTTTFLALVGMPYFLPLGVLSGFSSFIPYAGPFLVGASITLFAFATGGAWLGLATLVFFVVYDNLEGNVLAPLVFRKTVHVNPLVCLVAVVIFAEFGGVVGAILAVPFAAAAQIVLREFLAERRARLGHV